MENSRFLMNIETADLRMFIIISSSIYGCGLEAGHHQQQYYGPLGTPGKLLELPGIPGTPWDPWGPMGTHGSLGCPWGAPGLPWGCVTFC